MLVQPAAQAPEQLFLGHIGIARQGIQADLHQGGLFLPLAQLLACQRCLPRSSAVTVIEVADLGGELRQQVVERRVEACLLYTSPSPRDLSTSRMPSSA